jgi:hypothetical protein
MPMFSRTIYERAVNSCLLDKTKMGLGSIGKTYIESEICFTLVKLPPPSQVRGHPLWAYRGVMKIEYLCKQTSSAEESGFR